MSDYDAQRTKIKSLEAEIERLRAALRFYGNRANWRERGIGGILMSSSISLDGGQIARETGVLT